MAKIAGRKNDGAWFRFNQWILNQTSVVQAQFATQVERLGTLAPAHAIVREYMVDVGVAPSTFPDTPTGWAAELSIGIPRQVWDGVTTYDLYVKGAHGYSKLMQKAIFEFSVDLRHLCKMFRFASFEVAHLAGLTHPGQHAAVKLDRRDPVQRAARLAEIKQIMASPEFLETFRPAAAAQKSLTSSRDESIGTELRPRKSQPKGRGSASTPVAGG